MRAPLTKTVLNGDPLRPLARATVQVQTADGDEVTVYAARTGSTEAAALITDVYGRLPAAYVEQGDYDLEITAPNGGTWTEGFTAFVAADTVLRKGSALDEGSEATVTTVSQVLIDANTTRASATVSNKGVSGTTAVSTIVWISRSSEATVGQGQPVYPGQTLDITDYVGDVSAVAEGSVDVALSAT